MFGLFLLMEEKNKSPSGKTNPLKKGFVSSEVAAGPECSYAEMMLLKIKDTGRLISAGS